MSFVIVFRYARIRIKHKLSPQIKKKEEKKSKERPEIPIFSHAVKEKKQLDN